MKKNITISILVVLTLLTGVYANIKANEATYNANLANEHKTKAMEAAEAARAQAEEAQQMAERQAELAAKIQAELLECRNN